jgi:AraC family transcriptional regulator
MIERAARRPGDPSPPLLNVITASAPAGRFESPLADHHVLDIHLGDPVQVSCRMDGRERRGLQTHGSFCVVPAGLTGQWAMTRPLQALLIQLTPSLLAATADALGVRSRGPGLLPAMHVRDPQVERIGWALQAEHDDACPSGRLFTDSLALALAARLLGLQSRAGAAGGTSGRALPRWRLRNVLEYIEAHLDEDLTLAELSTVAGFSLSHFKALFRQAVGLPVHRYVLERRVERARVLLLEGGRTMAEIALAAGFAHQSHMARCLRRVLGLTPTQIADRSR